MGSRIPKAITGSLNSFVVSTRISLIQRLKALANNVVQNDSARLMISKYLQRFNPTILGFIAREMDDPFILGEIAANPSTPRNTLRFLAMKGSLPAYKNFKPTLSPEELFSLFLSVKKGSEIRTVLLHDLLTHRDSAPALIEHLIKEEVPAEKQSTAQSILTVKQRSKSGWKQS